MYTHRISLDQWHAFVAVVDHGGYAQAAQALHKSQSTISYAIRKLENLLGLQVLEIHGRKAVLTATGATLLVRARQLLQSAAGLERQAAALSRGIEPVVRLAIEAIVPRSLILAALGQLSDAYPMTRVELTESILSGTHEALLNGEADLIVTGIAPTGFTSEVLGRIGFHCLSSPRHPLQMLGRNVTLDDLSAHRQIVVRDSGPQRRFSAPWLEAGQRWTVSTLDTSLEALCGGLGFAWFPLSLAQHELDAGRLKAIPMEQGATRYVHLHLVYRDRATAGPVTRAFADGLSVLVRHEGAAHGIQPERPASEQAG